MTDHALLGSPRKSRKEYIFGFKALQLILIALRNVLLVLVIFWKFSYLGQGFIRKVSSEEPRDPVTAPGIFLQETAKLAHALEIAELSPAVLLGHQTQFLQFVIRPVDKVRGV
jgi:hypothetical protein